MVDFFDVILSNVNVCKIQPSSHPAGSDTLVFFKSSLLIIHINKLILLTFHFIRICIDNRHWQVEKYYLILMTLLVRRIPSVEPEVNLLGSTHLFRLSITLSLRHSSPDRDTWRVPV